MHVNGIIPARAGFTCGAEICSRGESDHPRSRGVYTPSPWTSTAVCGSSPLARGLPWVGFILVFLSGIIPARAGFTENERQDLQHDRDHPRSRGVYEAD